MKKILAAFLLLAGIAAAQTYGSFSGVVTGPTGIPVTNASVTICHVGAVIIGTDCAQKATIYSSAAGGALANPLTTNANGEFTFYAPPGDYTYSWNGNLYRASVMMAGNPVLAGLTIGSGPAMTSAPEMTWGGFTPSFTAGTSGSYGFGPFFTSSAITIKRILVSTVTPPNGCATSPVVDIYDVTANAPIAGSSVTVPNSTAVAPITDSGSLSLAISAGHQLVTQVSTNPAGCTTSAANINVTVQYQMQ